MAGVFTVRFKETWRKEGKKRDLSIAEGVYTWLSVRG